MMNKRLSLCLVLVLMPLLASCTGAMRSFDRATGGKEDGGERYLVHENKEWETILGCKSEQFRVIQEKDRKTPAWLLRQYIYARCGNYFVYGDFSNSIVLNLETSIGVNMTQNWRKDQLLNDIEIFPIEQMGRNYIKEEFKEKFKTAQFDEEELLWLLKQADLGAGLQHDSRKGSSEITHLFFATYVDPVAVKNERHIQYEIREFHKQNKKTFQKKRTFRLPNPDIWDIGDKTNPLSLLAKLQKAIEADSTKLTELRGEGSGGRISLWLRALDMEN